MAVGCTIDKQAAAHYESGSVASLRNSSSSSSSMQKIECVNGPWRIRPRAAVVVVLYLLVFTQLMGLVQPNKHPGELDL